MHDAWQDDPICGYERQRDFLLDIIEAGQESDITARLRFLAAAGSDEAGGYSDPHGGFFVPEGMAPQVLTVDPEVDPTADRITPVPMTTQVVKTNSRVDKNHTTTSTSFNPSAPTTFSTVDSRRSRFRLMNRSI